MPVLSLLPYVVGGVTLWLLLVSRLEAWIRGSDRDAPWQLLALLLGCGIAVAVRLS